MKTQTLLRWLVLATLAAALLWAQTELDRPDPLIAAIQDSSSFVLDMLAKAADQMSEEDYALEPTAEGCSFGQLLAHVAEANYVFCSLATDGKAVTDSFAYCDEAYAALTGATAKRMIEFMEIQRSILTVVMFRIHHSLLTYMLTVFEHRFPLMNTPEGNPRFPPRSLRIGIDISDR